MKRPDSFLTNTTAPAGRTEGAAKNNPGDDSGSGMDKEIYNDPAYASIAVIGSYRDAGLSNSDETTVASDMRDAIEELTDKRVTDSGTPANSLAEWDNSTTYTTVGELVTHKGFQFVAYNVTGNLAKDPFTNPDFWMHIPKPSDLLQAYFSGQVFSGGLSPMADRGDANYRQNIAFGRYRLGGNGEVFYNFFRVALDGTLVTGDATLEAILDVGGGNEYSNIDLVAPDTGTRTLIDMGERIVTPQSVSGENDTLGEVIEDRMQGHEVDSPLRLTNGQGNNLGSNFPRTDATIQATTPPLTGTLVDDGVNGTPRQGMTTRPKEFTEGASYIVVMLPV